MCYPRLLNRFLTGKSIIPLLLLALSNPADANVFVNIELNRKSVYIQQPFRVTITVYTTTWFTAPLVFDNLQIPNAFIVPSGKTQPGMFNTGGKQYPGVQSYYLVFPYAAGEFTVPSLEITAQSPPEGSATPQKITLHTKEQRFTVRDVPDNLKKEGAWFVAGNVTVHESWTPALKELKVGDVLKRTITVDAQGTLPQFIPEIFGQEKVKWASMYPQTASLTDTRNGGDASGRSTQSMIYLLEKAGNFTIPAIKITYWNPYDMKTYSRSIAEEQIQVAENPDLGILTTLKDSLAATAKSSVAPAQEKGPLLILGMRWYSFAGVCLVIICLLYLLIPGGRKIIRVWKKHRQAYLASESYYFRKFMRSRDSAKVFIQKLYCWWDNFRNKPSASIRASFEKKGRPNEINDQLSMFFDGKKPINTEKIKQFAGEYRNIVINNKFDDNKKINREQISGLKKK